MGLFDKFKKSQQPKVDSEALKREMYEKNRIAMLAVLGLSLFVLGACSNNIDNSLKETPTSKVEETTNNEEIIATDTTPSESEKTPEELYFEQIKHDAEWQMMPRDECKTVTIEDRTLRLEIYLTRNDKLIERYTDISDAVLAIESGYDWWDILVIDFGNLGVVTKTKGDLVDGHFEVTKDDFIKN